MKELQKKELQTGEMLPIMEHFYTLQGEGFYAGHSAYFIRLAGCDVGCHWCDVKESWAVEGHQIYSVEEIAEIATEYSKLIVITGGEPLMWNLQPLTSALKKRNCRIHIETSGAYPLSGDLDWITLSPKKNILPKEEIYKKANELKTIIYNQHDFKFSQEQAQKVSPNCLLYMQSEWDKKDQMYPKIVDFILKNPEWKMSIQIHKYLNIS